MGAFSALASAAGDVVGKVASTVSEHMGAVEDVFNRTEQGKMLVSDYKNIYQPVKAQLVESLSKQALDRAKADPTTPPINVGQIHSDASKAARHAWLGPKDSLGVTLAASVEKQHGVAHAQSLSNAVAFVLKDRVDPMAGSTVEGAAKRKIASPYSSFKANAVKAGVGLTSIEPSYTPPGHIERAVTSAIYSTFSPLMVIPHIATIINGALGSDPQTFLQGVSKSIGKSLSEGIGNYEALVSSGAFVETHMNAIREWNMMKATGAPLTNPVAKAIYKMVHQPGFSTLRDYNLLSGANVGKMTAEQLGRDLHSKGPTPRLIWQAQQFGLDPAKIMKSEGKLDDEDIGRAVYKFVNEHYFLDNALQRSQLLQSNWVGRILGTYHGYVTRQSKLMARSLANGFHRDGAVGVVKNLAIMSTIMPLFGEGIKTIQQTYRGQDAIGSLKEDIENISGKHGAKAFAETYFEAMGHVGAFGVYGHVLRGGYTHSILQSASGPLLSSAADLVQDSAQVGAKIMKGKPVQKSAAPVERDLMYDIPGVSLLGQFLAHRILPNSKDNIRKDPARELYHHMRGEDSYGNKIEPESK
jgi:hypothetical protein